MMNRIVIAEAAVLRVGVLWTPNSNLNLDLDVMDSNRTRRVGSATNAPNYVSPRFQFASLINAEYYSTQGEWVDCPVSPGEWYFVITGYGTQGGESLNSSFPLRILFTDDRG